MTGTELEKQDVQALAAAGLADLDTADLELPAVTLVQGLSRSHTEDDAPLGHFVNSVSGDDYGTELELVIVSYYRGRFLSDKSVEDGKTFVAREDIVPSNWPEQFAGRRFDELPEAEEQYKLWANQEGNSWGSGPLISTTYNYVGFLPSDPELPVRFSLMRMGTKTAKKINTILRASRAPQWANVLEIASALRRNKQDKPYYVATVRKGRATTPEEQQLAIDLAQQLQNVNVQFVGDESDEPAPPSKPAPAADALDID